MHSRTRFMQTAMGVSAALLASFAGTGSAMGASTLDINDATISSMNGSNESVRDTSVRFFPRSQDVLFNGTVDVSNISDNGGVLFGLVDADYEDSSGTTSDGVNKTYQSGAYGFIGRVSNRTTNNEYVYRIGVSDGNSGAEVVQNFFDVDLADADDGIIPVNLRIGDGTLSLTSSLQAAGSSPITDTYGDIKSRYEDAPPEPYSGAEFANGAYVGADYGTGNGTVTFNGTVTAVPTPAAGMLGLVGFGLLALRRRRRGESV